MKSKFKEFYVDEEINFKSLDESVLIVFDTNVLLNIFRYSNETRDILIDSIENIIDNVWVPYHVALEYNLNKREIIESMRDINDKTTKSIDNKTKSFKNELAVILDNIGIRSQDEKQIRKKLKDSINEMLDDTVSKWKEDINSLEFSLISNNEDKSNLLAEILDGCVGDCYNQEKINDIVSEGEDRYKKKIPPGFMDNKEPKKQDFVTHGEIKYQKKYGDLIFWNQIIEKANNTEIKKVVLVSDEEKEDWVYKINGKIIGPHVQLITELKDKSNADLYFFNTNTFISNIKNEGPTKYVDNSSDNMKKYMDFEADTESMIKNQINYNQEQFRISLTRRYREIEKKMDATMNYAKAIKESLTDILDKSNYRFLEEKISHEFYHEIYDDMDILDIKLDKFRTILFDIENYKGRFHLLTLESVNYDFFEKLNENTIGFEDEIEEFLEFLSIIATKYRMDKETEFFNSILQKKF